MGISDHFLCPKIVADIERATEEIYQRNPPLVRMLREELAGPDRIIRFDF